MPDLADPPWKVLPSLRNGWGWVGGTVEGPGSKEGVGTGVGLQNEIRFFKN